MKHIIYAHKITSIGDFKTELKYAVKIGYTTNYKSRMKSYRSHGDHIHEILKVEVVSKEVDDSLKTWLTENKYNVTTNTKGSTEVYDLSETHAIKILKYIENNDTIDYNSLSYIINNNEVSLEKITLRTFRNRFGVDYITHEFQRPTIDERVELIKNGILESHNTPYHDIGIIQMVKLQDGRYGIIDGNHRAKAIAAINKNHDILNDMITISKRNVILSKSQTRELFIIINNIVPVSDIYKSDQYITKIKNNIVARLRNNYGSDCVIDNGEKNSGIAIPMKKIDDLVSKPNIEQLIKNKCIDNFSEAKDIYKLLQEINDILADGIIDVRPDLLTLSNDITPESKGIDDIYNIYTQIHTNKTLSRKPCIVKLNKIKRYYRTKKYIKIKGSCNIKTNKPFFLSLTSAKSKLLDLIKIFTTDNE